MPVRFWPAKFCLLMSCELRELYVLGAATSCAFEGLLASCHKTLGGIPVQATAVINHCHEPIDITFILQSSHDYNVSRDFNLRKKSANE